nr:MAG TPA: Protein of unknown function (DUF2634) [Caudoviricetes sp.]
MALDIPIPIDGVEEESEITSRTYAIDWENGRIRGFVDEQEAVKQYMKKALLTPRFKCLIYDNSYGSEINDEIIKNSATRDYIEADLPFLIKDTLIHDERILDIKNIEFEFTGSYPSQDSVLISFDADTIYGTIEVEEVI